MPYNSGTGAYERRSTTVIDASPDGDTVYIAIDAKLDQAADDTVTDLNHHKTNGNHYPATSTHTDSRFLKQSPAGSVAWADGVPAADAALKDFSNVASGAIAQEKLASGIAPAKIAQDASNRFTTDAEKSTWNASASATVSGRVELATDAEVQAGTDAERAVTPAGMKAGQIVRGAPVAASGTAVEFTGFPSWAKRIAIYLDGVSTNGSNSIIVLIGNGSVDTSGYVSCASNISTTVTTQSVDYAFIVQDGTSSTVSASGVIVLDLCGSNKWSMRGELCYSIAATSVSSGVKTLSGQLSIIQVSTSGLTDTFDSGNISISWE